MNTFLKKWRKENLNKANIGKYLLYAVGEIILITLGVLIAVNINERQTNKKNAVLRCQYLEELNYVFEYDIRDVEENIYAFEMWNPKVIKVLEGIQNKNLASMDSDSLHENLATVGKYIFFGQRSKTKMEELKYSSIDLIGNRKLKNKILLYQDELIMYLRNMERISNLVEEELRQYYSKNFHGFYMTNAIPFDLKKIESDNQFESLIWQRISLNNTLKYTYQRILKEQQEIKEMLEKEIGEKCNVENQN